MKYIVLLLGLLCLQSTCSRDEYDCQGISGYYFDTGGVSIYPTDSILRVGDTLHLVFDDSTLLYDQKSNTYIDYTNANKFTVDKSILYFNDSLYKQTKTNFYPNRALGGEFTDYGVKIGTYELESGSTDFVMYVHPLVSQKRIRYHVWYKFKKRGIYQIGFKDAGTLDSKTGCNEAYFSMYIKNKDHHIGYSLQYQPPDYKPGYYDLNQLYAVRVE